MADSLNLKPPRVYLYPVRSVRFGSIRKRCIVRNSMFSFEVLLLSSFLSCDVACVSSWSLQLLLLLLLLLLIVCLFYGIKHRNDSELQVTTTV